MWDDCRTEYSARWPRFQTDFEGLLDGLRELQFDNASATIWVGLADQSVGRRTWLGRLPSDEMAALVGAALHFRLEVSYPDGSYATIANLPRKRRTIQFTAGVAQDAVHRFRIELRRIGLRRRVLLVLPSAGACVAATASMTFAISYVSHPSAIGIIATCVSGAAALICFVGPLSSGSALPTRGRRTRVNQLEFRRDPQSKLEARHRLITFSPINAVDVAISLCLTFVAALLERWL
ncbi:hypothetical protein EV650_3183 [Kribbella kalugense]|uniref:Uncharacterized protein n=2 Tax=Kribbella kalugense TaxID=2512221 RepID=A0A4R8A1B7_9ACTN|nr:hypothetical protein EV650_3183 [Kribbella kalugense]